MYSYALNGILILATFDQRPNLGNVTRGHFPQVRPFHTPVLVYEQ